MSAEKGVGYDIDGNQGGEQILGAVADQAGANIDPSVKTTEGDREPKPGLSDSMGRGAVRAFVLGPDGGVQAYDVPTGTLRHKMPPVNGMPRSGMPKF